MSSTEKTYRDAAKEHLERAQNLFNDGSYFLAHYMSGLAVECHLRAWRYRATKEFESRHDLRLLAKESGFNNLIPTARDKEFSSMFGVLNLRWRSNHRYYSERQLLDYWSSSEVKAEFNVRGERWKNAARTILDYSYEIIKQGEIKWDKADFYKK